ncbi:AI-2E family transporter [Candidatus Saccharibacteria bacterium]|nr:AI-2E family transporter [Candidatus Saccharibacteria bacterium]
MDGVRKIVVTVTNRTIVRAILWITTAVIIYKFIGEVSHVLTLIFGAFFLALALNPVVSWMNHRLRIKSRVRATAASYLLVVGVLVGFLVLVVPPLVRQTRDFIQEFPETVESFQQQDNSIARAFERYNLNEKLAQGAKDFTTNYGNFGSTVFDTGKRVAETIASFFIVIVLAFMMLVEGPKWLELLFGTLPDRQRLRYRKLSKRMYKAVTGFVNGQVILAAIAGIFAFVALEVASRLLDADINALALAGIVAVFGVIPLFGNPIAAALVVLASLLSSASLALVMAIYFTVYFFIENHTFQPYLQSRLNELTPLMVFVAALIGVSLGGILGAVAAIPVASTIKILLEDYFERRQKHKASIETSSSI